LQQALKLDPKFAPTWAELARARLLAFAAFGESNYQTSHAGTLEAAHQALTLDPGLAFAHAVLGQELFAMDWDWGGAERQLQRAIELDPGDPGTLALASQFALSQGRYTEAQRLAQSTIARDPLGVPGYRHLGNADYFAGELVAAEAAFRKVLELYPAADGIRYKLALVLLSRGDAPGALSEMQHERHAGWRQQGLPLALDALGRKADADRALAAAEKDGPQGWAYQLALSYAHRKSLDQAFAWLDKAYQQHDVGLATYLVGDPLLANIRTDARFKALLHKLKLPE
jgi:eukaryotic-like serine/threonine-protein kinase